jgi:cell division protein FtsB
VVGTPSQARSRAGLVIGCLALLGVGLVGLLLLNVNLDKGAFVLRQQQADTNRLLAERQSLQEQLAALQAPQTLEEHARRLGMVSAPNVAFVRSSDGKVLGVSKRAVADPRSIVTAGNATPGSASTTGSSPSASTTPTPASTAGPASTPAAAAAAAPTGVPAVGPVQVRAARPSATTKVTATGKAAARTTSSPAAGPGKGTAAKRKAPAVRKRPVKKPAESRPTTARP